MRSTGNLSSVSNLAYTCILNLDPVTQRDCEGKKYL